MTGLRYMFGSLQPPHVSVSMTHVATLGNSCFVTLGEGGGIHALLTWGRSGAGLTLPGHHTLDGFIVDLICLGLRSFHSLLVVVFILLL